MKEKKDPVEITAWLDRTVQINQYEPLKFGLSIKKLVQEENIEEELDKLTEIIHERVTEYIEAHMRKDKRKK